MTKLNITETNMLAVLNKHGKVPKVKVSAGGRYHIALTGLVRAGFAELVNNEYRMTTKGREYLDSVVTRDGSDARSKMKLK